MDNGYFATCQIACPIWTTPRWSGQSICGVLVQTPYFANFILLGLAWKWLDVCVLTLDYLIGHVDNAVVSEIWEIYGVWSQWPFVYIVPICQNMDRSWRMRIFTGTPSAFAIDAGLLVQRFNLVERECKRRKRKKSARVTRRNTRNWKMGTHAHTIVSCSCGKPVLCEWIKRNKQTTSVRAKEASRDVVAFLFIRWCSQSILGIA